MMTKAQGELETLRYNNAVLERTLEVQRSILEEQLEALDVVRKELRVTKRAFEKAVDAYHEHCMSAGHWGKEQFREAARAELQPKVEVTK